MAGFFLSGVLLAFLGAVLPAWSYHLQEDFLTVGSYFLGMNAGMLLAVAVSFSLLSGKDSTHVLTLASLVACAAFIYLALTPMAAAAWRRTPGVFGVGAAAGLANRGAFQAISGLYRHNPAATLNLAGTFFGLGCVVVSLLVAGAFYVYTVPSILGLVAFIPGFFLMFYIKAAVSERRLGKAPAAAAGRAGTAPIWAGAGANLKDATAILLALTLFFQFGNEWSVAGWMPLFLSRRLGVSPATSLLMLTLYWLALLVGRAAASALLPRLSHARLLGGSVLAALFGCTILFFTDNRFGAVTGILFVGGGFASVYPLVVERIEARYPTYHPGSFNGIFSFAVTGGLLAPWSLGFFAERWGVGAVMALPLLGTLLVFLLLLVLWAESKLTASA